MKVVYCDNSYSTLWDTFLKDNESSSFYQLFGWKEVNEKSFGHKTFYLASLEGERIRGVFPMVYIKSRMMGKIICSMPFVNFGGICAEDKESEILLANEAISIAKKHQIDYLEIRGLGKINCDLPTSEHKISMTVELEPDPDLLWNAFQTKHRTNIRRVYKNGLSVRFGSTDVLDVFYEILSESWRDLGTPLYQKRYFLNIITRFPDSIKIFIVYYKDIPIAAAFNGYYKNTVEGMWLGIREKYKKLQPNYVLYWEMIKHSCENNFKYFHLGRSSVESGGEFFKKKWHAVPKQLYWQYFLGESKQIPQLNVNNPKYKLAINTWKRLPVRLTNIIGPIVAKNIP